MRRWWRGWRQRSRHDHAARGGADPTGDAARRLPQGAYSLAALAAEMMGEALFSGVVLVFRSKRADRIKLVVCDGSGLVLVLVWRQLKAGAFRCPPVVDGALRLTPSNLQR
ncbi:IS66 family insertion sequence element accessory protein TnpB [Paeniroseomonas aquatica]|uniref:IS66 family insertion sequence element accessory protein TnpB n=1 Tax=Paeniroseomonas aquatica TaxID=373043 RepID=A0ABT7ZZG5_9PROT|nr:IS66 family insertion sequence element accessory protein TnpB [Paeniroseomonas aquatica]MDN3562860.1 IS66 family insertion sequence element accessory protein TnpB [Paeniroseomonas aquatica]